MEGGNIGGGTGRVIPGSNSQQSRRMIYKRNEENNDNQFKYFYKTGTFNNTLFHPYNDVGRKNSAINQQMNHITHESSSPILMV